MSNHTTEHHEGPHVPDHWETSPWPLVVSGGVFFLCWAFMFQFVYHKPMVALLSLAIGTILVIMSIIGWIGETVGKADFGYAPSAMLFYIFTEGMIFLAFFAAYWRMRLMTTSWPPEGTPEISATKQLIGFIVLIIAAIAGHQALAKYKDEPESTGSLLMVPFILGLIFLGIVYADLSGLVAQGFTISTNGYSTTVFGLGGWHAAHILVAAVIYLLIALSTMKGNYCLSFVQAAVIFWDFCTIAHFFVLFQVYVW